MARMAHQIAVLVDDARLANAHQVLRIGKRNLRFELIAGKAGFT